MMNSRMSSLFLLLAAGAGLLGASRLFRGRNVIMYQADGENAAEFRRVADRYAQALGTRRVYAITSGLSALTALREEPRIGRLILVGHGSARAFFRPGFSGLRMGATKAQSPMVVSLERFAQILADQLTPGFTIGLAGCQTGLNPGELDTWYPEDGGQGGFAGRFRDLLVEHGAPIGTVRGHTVAGHASRARAGRAFRVIRSMYGRPGVGARMDSERTAELWLLGIG